MKNINLEKISTVLYISTEKLEADVRNTIGNSEIKVNVSDSCVEFKDENGCDVELDKIYAALAKYYDVFEINFIGYDKETLFVNLTSRSNAFTDEERYEIYCEVAHEYLLNDAERAFTSYVGVDDASYIHENEEAFVRKYGFTTKSALNPADSNYLLERIVKIYENHADCNIPENCTWENSVITALEEILAKQETVLKG